MKSSHAGGNPKFDERTPEVNKDRQAAGVSPHFDERKNPLRLVTPYRQKETPTDSEDQPIMTKSLRNTLATFGIAVAVGATALPMLSVWTQKESYEPIAYATQMSDSAKWPTVLVDFNDSTSDADIQAFADAVRPEARPELHRGQRQPPLPCD